MMRSLIMVVMGLAVAAGVGRAEPPSTAPQVTTDADRLWETLSAEKQRLLIKHAPKYVRASDGRIYLTQVEEEQKTVSRKPEKGRTERERAIIEEGAPVLYHPATRKSFESREQQYTTHCNQVTAEWEARCATIRRAELAKVPGDYVTALEVVQVLTDGLLVKLEGDGNKHDDRLVRLDKYPLNKVVVDGDRLRADMKVKSVGRYQYTSTIGATKTIERFEVVKVFEWEGVLPKLNLPARTFTAVKPAEIAFAATMENWPGLPEWRIKKVKTSEGRDGGDVVGQSDSGWFTTRYVARHDNAVLQTYEWRWEVRHLPLLEASK